MEVNSSKVKSNINSKKNNNKKKNTSLNDLVIIEKNNSSPKKKNNNKKKVSPKVEEKVVRNKPSNTPKNNKLKQIDIEDESLSLDTLDKSIDTSTSKETLLQEGTKEEELSLKEEETSEVLTSLEKENIKEDLTREIPFIKKEEVSTYLKNNFKRNLTINDKYNYEDFEDDYEDSTTKHSKIKIIPLIIILLILLLTFIIYLTIPKIKLYGDNSITLSYKDDYKEPGFIAKKDDKDITSSIKINSNLKEHTIGVYQINYETKYLFLTIKKTRTITIVDKDKPVITVDTDPIKACPNTTLDELSYKVFDDYDGDITKNTIVHEENDLVIFNAKDSSLNESTLKVKIIREDKTAPVITLKGNKTIYLTRGDTFTDPGYTANDNCDGDITNKVEVNGVVDSNIGKYIITYKVSDSTGNTTTVSRTIIRRNNHLPENSGTILNNTIYLTFDDGPSADTTSYILDVLKEENVKATFFITCNGPDYLIKRMYDEGHTVALHTASHNYSYVYSSTENYFADLKRVSDRVKRITGQESKIIRFPGGSSNTISRTYHRGIMTELTNEVVEKGYHYYDWNVDSNDAGGASSSTEVYYNVINNLSPYRANMVLMHDIKYTTKDAIKSIIEYGKNNGYTFKKIEEDTYMIRHAVNN